MAVTVRTQQENTGTGTSVTVTTPTRSALDLLVAVLITPDGGTATTPTGWDLRATSTNDQVRIYTRIATNTTADDFSSTLGTSNQWGVSVTPADSDTNPWDLTTIQTDVGAGAASTTHSIATAFQPTHDDAEDQLIIGGTGYTGLKNATYTAPVQTNSSDAQGELQDYNTGTGGPANYDGGGSIYFAWDTTAFGDAATDYSHTCSASSVFDYAAIFIETGASPDATATCTALAATATFPTVVADVGIPIVLSRTTGVKDVAATSHTITLPATIDDGDMIVVFIVGAKNEPTFSWNTDGTAPVFTELTDDAYVGNDVSQTVGYRICDGTEDGDTIDVDTSGSTMIVYAVYRITGAGSIEAGTAVGATTATPNPPSLSPSGGADAHLWIEFAGTSWGSTVTAASTNYTDLTTETNAGANDAALGIAEYGLYAATEDPGTMTISSSEVSIVNTFAVAPGAADGDAPATALEVTSTFDPVTVANNVNATADQTGEAIPGQAWFPTVTALANATPVLTTLEMAGTFDQPTVANEINADAPLTTIPLSSTFDPVTVANNVNATTLIIDEDFVGVDGDPWNTSIWQDAADSDAGTITIQSNQGEMATNGATSQAEWTHIESVRSHTDASLLIKYEQADAETSSGIYLIFRHDGAWTVSGDNEYPTNGYSVSLFPEVDYQQVHRWDAGSPTVLTQGNQTQLAATAYWVRAEIFDHTLRYRIWEDGAGEPSSWSTNPDATEAHDSGGFAILYRTTGANGVLTIEQLDLSYRAHPVTATLPAVTAVSEVNATATCTTLTVTPTFDSVTVANDVNADASATTLPVGATFDPAAVHASAATTPLAVSRSFPAVVTENNVNANGAVTSLPAPGTFPSVTTVGEVNAAAVCTTLIVGSTFDPVTAFAGSSAVCTILTVGSTFDAVTVANNVNAAAPLTTLVAASTFPAATVLGEVNATATLTALAVDATLLAPQVSAAASLTTLEAAATLPTVTTANNVNADAPLSASPAQVTFDPVVAVGTSGNTALLTALPVAATFDPVTAIGQVNATAVGTTLGAAATFPTAVAVGETSATTTPTSLSVTGTLPDASGSASVTLTALSATSTLPTVTPFIGVAVPLTALPVGSTFPGVVTANEVNADTAPTAFLITASFPAVTAQGAISATAPTTALAVSGSFPAVTATGSTSNVAALTTLHVAGTFPSASATGTSNAAPTAITLPVAASFPAVGVLILQDASPLLSAILVDGSLPAVSARALAAQTKGDVAVSFAAAGLAVTHRAAEASPDLAAAGVRLTNR